MEPPISDTGLADTGTSRDTVLSGRVVGTRAFGSMVELTLAVPGWRGALPGQFAMIRLEGSARFLPRAFSVEAEPPVHPGAPEPLVSFLISPIGPGTRELVNAHPGQTVAVVGPLGRGFDADVLTLGAAVQGEVRSASPHGPRLLIVGGGVGVAPFPLLIREVSRRVARGTPLAADVLLLLGFRDAAQAEVLGLFEAAVKDLAVGGLRIGIQVVCEDGSLGRRGLVTELVRDHLRPGDVVMCCGAHAMCAAVWDLCIGRGVRDVWFSLEADMACGVGACQGCVLPSAGGGLVRVCREGPVFAGGEIFGSPGEPSADEAGAL